MAEAILGASGIYVIRHIESGKSYVGSAVNIRQRWCGHRSDLIKGRHRNQILQRAFNKYGLDAFSFDVLEYVSSKDNLIQREQFWIDSLDVVANGYNIAPLAGSNLGAKWSEESKALHSARLHGRIISAEHRAKLSIAGMGRTHSPEQKEKARIARTGVKMPQISAALTGKPRPRAGVEKQRLAITGRKQTPEAIENKRRAMTGKKRTDKARENMSKAQKGRVVSDETKEKIRAAISGKKHSPETIEKRKQAIQNMSAEKRAAMIDKISASGKGRKLSPEAIAKRQLSRYGLQPKI